MFGAVNAIFSAGCADHVIDQAKQTASLRGKFIQRSSQNFVGKLIGDRDVIERDFDVFDLLPVVLDSLEGALILMKQGNDADKRQVLGMVATGSGFIVQERKRFSKRIGNQKRPQEPLGIAM